MKPGFIQSPGPNSRPAYVLQRGDHIYCRRFSGIEHDGIYLGGDQVIHFTSLEASKLSARIQITSVAQFAGSDAVSVLIYGACISPDEVVRRALSRFQNGDYGLFGNNCQHFATWCKTGVARSRQVEFAMDVASGVAKAMMIFATMLNEFQKIHAERTKRIAMQKTAPKKRAPRRKSTPKRRAAAKRTKTSRKTARSDHRPRRRV